MDYQRLTAPCGLDCFNCHFYLAHEKDESMEQLKTWSKMFDVPIEVMFCKGCKDENGQIPLQKHLFGEAHFCAAYKCAKEQKHDLCCDCGDFPCDNLHPYADRANDVPHNTKVFNLCLIKKMGLEEWARSKALKVRKKYAEGSWTLGPVE